MIVDFDKIEALIVPHMNGGDLEIAERTISEDGKRMTILTVPVGASIGSHFHFDSAEYDYVISGEGTAVIDELTEFLKPGVMHICKAGSVHSILNTGDEELVLLSIIG